jgi:hypothetical protein
MPCNVLIDPKRLDRTGKPAASSAMNPEAIVIDHGKIYVSAHVCSVCQQLGISIQPARIRVGRDKGPFERFFRTVREGCLQYLPGYKGPDINARGLDVKARRSSTSTSWKRSCANRSPRCITTNDTIRPRWVKSCQCRTTYTMATPMKSKPPPPAVLAGPAFRGTSATGALPRVQTWHRHRPDFRSRRVQPRLAKGHHCGQDTGVACGSDLAGRKMWDSSITRRSDRKCHS